MVRPNEPTVRRNDAGMKNLFIRLLLPGLTGDLQAAGGMEASTGDGNSAEQMAEGEGLEPPRPEGRQFSRLLPYH